MAIRIYGHPGCTTVKRARDWAEKQGLEAGYTHFSSVADLRRQLAAWVQVAGMDRVFNSRSQTFRKLADDERAKIEANDNAQLDAMVADPRLIRRPVATNGKVVLTGFNDEEWAAAFR